MKRDLLSRSLAQMGSKTAATPGPSGTDEGAPRALKSMSDVLAQVSSQSAQDVNVNDIADSDIADRFDVSVELDALVESIQTSGQQLPALLRYRRGAGPRYEVVYGRRRIAACRRLGIQVKAFIKEMDPREALVSQALENSARLERSFIEQAIFSVKLEDQGFTRAEICDVLAVDKGTLSKLIGVAKDVPEDVIYGIGAAHDVGRRQWLELRRLFGLEGRPTDEDAVALLPTVGSGAEKIATIIKDMQATEHAVPARAAKSMAAPPAPPRKIGDTPVAYMVKGHRLTIEISDKKEHGFIGFVEDNLEKLYSAWKDEK
ncbi:chromosome partitioning protein, ParB family [Loktanella salsilacus]|jgi:ParB family chromosome partitioning protein|uniref:Chromosome partitioning protein, ParB family n=1 Tax=Loktanella salsilacus TaxID=195913 RepID=A0A1I4ILD4_9RHOB|nr:plasmid partitioning protein RepB [Loktanella salsilacus]SFL55172.1 chromosome partitioning protein, ParB family [Loktanella salsilacus]